MLIPEAKGQGRKLKRQAWADILLGFGGVITTSWDVVGPGGQFLTAEGT